MLMGETTVTMPIKEYEYMKIHIRELKSKSIEEFIHRKYKNQHDFISGNYTLEYDIEAIEEYFYKSTDKIAEKR